MRHILLLIAFICSQAFGQSHNSNSLRRHSSNNKIPYDPNTQIFGNFVNNGLSFITPTTKLQDDNLAVSWNPTYDVYYPNDVIYEMDGLYAINKIVVYDNNPGSVFVISSGLNVVSLTTDGTITLNTNSSQTVNLSNKQVRFISFKLASGAGPTEIRIYGQNVSKDPIKPIVLRPSRTFEKFLGWDCNVFSPDSLMPWKTSRRHYDFTDKIVWSTTEWVFQPNKQDVYLDDYYKYHYDRDKDIYPLWNNAPDIYKQSYIDAGKPWDSENKAIYYGANPYNKSAWKKEGETAFQMAARYGRTHHPDSSLKIDLTWRAPYGNAKKSGLGILKYLEYDNETDRWWKYDTAKSMLPLQQFWQMSVRYDGHNNSMGPLVGMRNADTTLKLVGPALADFNLDYFKMMKWYSEVYRTDKMVPFDVFNYHSYINTGGGQFSEASVGLAPELAVRKGASYVGLKEMLADRCDWILRNCPGKEICWSEYGYDTGPASYCGVPLLTQAEALAAAFPQNAHDLQASLLIRTAIEAQSTRRLDNVILFELMDEINYKDVVDTYKDVPVNPIPFYNYFYGGSQFATSGITHGQYNYRLGTYAPGVIFGTTTGTITLSYDKRHVYFRWPSAVGDTIDLIDESNYSNRAKVHVISQTDSTVTVALGRYEGSGTFTEFVIQTPYAKKAAWYAFNNCFKTFGDCYLVADSSRPGYRDYVYRDSANTKEVRVIWKPTQDGSQLNSIRINYPNTNQVTQRLFLSRTGAVASVTEGSKYWLADVNEQPKIFYYSIAGTPNVPPIANAGVDKNIITTSTTLPGSATDEDGTIASYAWSKVSGGSATLSGTTTATLSLTGLSVGAYVFRLTATDNLGATDFDDVTLTVSSSNQPPIAYNGSATVTTSSVVFYADATDPENGALTRLWSQNSGPNTATFSSTTTYMVTITGLINGSYVFKCIVTDNGGAKDTSFFTCNVSGVGGGTNSPPTANAGSDQAISSATTTIAGSGTDSDGSIAFYAWTKITGGPATLANSNTSTLSLSGLTNGTYTFRLTVSDNLGATGFDEVNVVVTISTGGGTTVSSYVDYDQISAIGPGGVVIPTLVYLPIGYGAAGVKFPVIVACGGLGEKYNSTISRAANFANIKAKFIYRYLQQGNDIPFVVVMPMISLPEFDSYDGSQSGPNYSPGLVTHEVRQSAIDNYRGDPERCHLTGLSLGGQTICASSIAYPNDWATCTVIASSVLSAGFSSVRAVFNVIINQDDNQYLGGPPYNHVQWVEQLNLSGHIPFTSTYTVYASGGHGGWNEEYDLTAASKTLWVNSSVPNNTPYFNPYTWMLKYKIVSGVVSLY